MRVFVPDRHERSPIATHHERREAALLPAPEGGVPRRQRMMIRSRIAAAALAIVVASPAPVSAVDFEGRTTRLGPAPPMHMNEIEIAPTHALKYASLENAGRHAPSAMKAEAAARDAATWRVKPGDTLRGALKRWASRAGWQVAWISQRRYDIQAGARFHGSFVDAATQLLAPYAHHTPPVKAEFNGGNRVLVVRTPGI